VSVPPGECTAGHDSVPAVGKPHHLGENLLSKADPVAAADRRSKSRSHRIPSPCEPMSCARMPVPASGWTTKDSLNGPAPRLSGSEAT
jgi:hypothetical protein